MSEQEHTPPTRNIKKPTLVTIGDRQAMSHGMWNHDVIAKHLIENAESWHPVGELARIVWQRSSETTRREVCRRLAALKRVMLDNHKQLIVVHYNGPRNSANEVKLY